MNSNSRRRYGFSAALFLFFLILGQGSRSWGAACCASSGVFPALISGDEKAQVTLSAMSTRVVADVSAAGEPIPRAADDREDRQTAKLDVASLISDLWQVGVSVPSVRRSRTRDGTEAQASGIGDIAVTLGYEAFPAYEYSDWKPRGYLFVQVGLPTGVSAQTASALYRVDARGRGSVNLSAGTYLLRAGWGWDASLLLEGHRPLPRTTENNFGPVSLHPGWGASAALSVGYSPANGPLRLGVSISPAYEGPLEIQGAMRARTAAQWQWSSVLQAGFLISEAWTVSANYTDQTWWGPSSNVALNRGFGILIQKRWDR